MMKQPKIPGWMLKLKDEPLPGSPDVTWGSATQEQRQRAIAFYEAMGEDFLDIARQLEEER